MILIICICRSRNCIGKNFALQEMRIALATFFKHYDIAPIEKEMQDSKDIRQYITMSVAKSSFSVKIKRR
jgi:cytochrome P450